MTMDGTEKARRLIAEEREKKTGFLDLGKLQLTEVPIEIFQLSHLRSLNLGSGYVNKRGEFHRTANGDKRPSNALPALPDGLHALGNLVALSLVGNPLSDLSPLQGLPGLLSLNCWNTQVSDLRPLQGLTGLQYLNCSGTQLSDLSPLQGLAGLQFLNCRDTQVSDLSPLQGLAGLQYLNFWGTRVSDLSPLQGLPGLQFLICRGTQVSDLGLLQGIPGLQSLDCSGTQVSDLSPLQGIPGLRSVVCRKTQVSALSSLQGIPGLQSLDCSGTQVSDLSPLQGLRGLQSLDCSGTQVSDLSPLQGLPGLQHLNCEDIQVSDLSPLHGLRGLQSLDCSGTQVSDLSPLQGLRGLQSLDCSGTQVSDLSPLQGLPGLQSLDCSGTQVSDLSPLQGLHSLKSLLCGNTQVSDLSGLHGVTSLQFLACGETQVSDLSPLKDLPGLRHLYCDETQVSDLNPLQGLPRLQYLNCGRTQVSDLGPLQGVPGLRSLNCLHTPVSDLSPLQGLAGFQYLNCSHTRVSDLSLLQGLSRLQSLNCSHTQVSDLSPLIGSVSLRKLDANYCRLADLPRNLLLSETLQTLFLCAASIPGIPPELLSPNEFVSCLAALRNHLTDLDAGTENVREAKLVVLGNGRVGKTQICRRMRGLPYDENVSSTHGITVTAERWSGSSEDEVLNIWDFGGQDIYHGVHTLFMKTSAIFLIVWHPDFETAGEQTLDGLVYRNYPLPYWLEYVRTLGRKDCPVVVVQARCDRPQQEARRLPADDTFLDFPSLKPCWYSAKSDRGQGALDDAVRDAIEFLRERDGIVTIGAGRMRVLRQLEAWRQEDQARPAEEREHRTLSQITFQNLCEQVGGVSSPASLLAYLHNLGVVFHQPDLFHDRIILDQSWALEAVYGVFDRCQAYPLIVSQGGRFTQSLLAMTAWTDYAESEQRLFLSLMQSCGIAFLQRDADQRLGLETEYLAPDMLPSKGAVAAQLAGRWNDTEQTWRLEYEYPFLHPGLMRTVLCDVGRLSHESGVYWKYGLWVYEKATGCRALIEQQMADQRRGRILLKLQGSRHEELARWLRERIEDRNRLFGYPDLKPVVDDLAPEAEIPLKVVASHTPIAGRKHGAASPGEDHDGGGYATGDEQEPSFDKPPASFFPHRQPQVFVSYAWGDETPEGRRRAEMVDDLCTVLGQQKVKVRRDRDEMRPGDLISEFMDRLAEGDFVLAVISDKYLRSEYCMYELFSIYRNCADKPTRFVEKVVPLILADATLADPAERLQRAIYWTQMEAKLKPLVEANVEAVGTEFFRKFKLVGEFARNTSNMLEYLVDKLQPRDFERQAAEGFREVLRQISEPVERG